ncbi:ectoine/hydroxyectoine ABC transporter permease subunit EhuD [Naumannella halotolerans]|uniref:Polar amino acid transport system permease protein n=1 Tax=Naumannella halotolerans TaxID=993414 RepID=A0A4R7J5W5_9ACTN|nr:ectoine/hydroxyectoine ABC transporter permease subunit EhuD [Naumannella halotolerans]TDT32614.1 polar amino acid transport system permease protein [Naumannella halotolerans]
MIWDNEFALSIVPALLQGFLTTIEITLLGTALAAALGLVVAILRHLRIPVISRLLTFSVLFVRGTPLLVQAYFAFFVLPSFGLTFSALATGVVVIGINYSAYMAEVYRAGIESVPKGQWEAATALNLPRGRVWSKIVLPQALRTVVPMLGNYLIMMFKDSAILSAITVVELMAVAQQIGSSEFRYLEPMTIAAVLYFIVSYPSSILVNRLEARLAHS